MKTISIQAARDLASQAMRDLDGFHGDPSKRANWIRERQLAMLVVALIDRIRDAAQDGVDVS